MRDPRVEIQQIIDGDVERGLQVAAYFNGELVVDAWSGVADPTTGRKVNGETLLRSGPAPKALPPPRSIIWPSVVNWTTTGRLRDAGLSLQPTARPR